MRIILLACTVALSACAIRAAVPFGPGPIGVGPGSIDPGDATAEPGAAPEVAGTSSPSLACVQDRGGADFGTARAIRAGGHQGCIEAKHEVFAIVAPQQARAGALYTMRLTADDQICVSIYDEDRQRQGTSCSDSREPRAFWAAIAPGTVLYLQLERTQSQASPFVLDIREQLLDDPDEPNNGIGHAVALELGVEHTALMQRVLNDPKLEADVYAIDVTSSGRLSIVVDPGSGDATAEVEVFDADRRKIDGMMASNEGAVLRGSAKVKRGRYFVRVHELHTTVDAAGASTTVDEKPSGHYSKPYTIKLDLQERVSSR